MALFKINGSAVKKITVKNLLLKKNRIYTKHQSFNVVYEELKNKPNAEFAGFKAPQKYHHAPEQLDVFTDYRGYIKWSNELCSASSKLVSELKSIYNKAKKASSSSWYSCKDGLNTILKELDELESDLENLYDDIVEFQSCMLATVINEKHAETEALSNQVRHLDFLETNIVETCNRKLYEISSSRITFTGTFIAICALFVSIVSLFYS